MLGSSYLECSAGQPSCEFMQGSGAKVDVVLGATDLAASGVSGVRPVGWLSRLFADRPGLVRMRDVGLHEVASESGDGKKIPSDSPSRTPVVRAME